MPARVVSREVETRTVGDFLTSVADEPAALIIEGEAGIGKTTLWLAGMTQARDRGFAVLSTRPVAAESVLAYAALADLLGGLDIAVWDKLADAQRLALDRLLYRADNDGAIDQRAVAAGFLSAVEWQAEQSPVVLAVDDLQWLDPSSARVLAFAARRLTGRVGVLGTVRSESDTAATSWLQLPRPDAIHRIGIPPMSLGSLHAVLTERLGRSFPRPTMVWIHQVSAGNPFYALELGRAVQTARATNGQAQLPGTLAELVRTRIGHLDSDAKELLLAAASVAAPTVELLTSATKRSPDRVNRLLDDVEDKGIVTIDGRRVRFAHPLLAHGVYTGAGPAGRRAMHKRLAEIEVEPELKARHLALAATGADTQTLQSLDAAAESARRRGAPAAAAELLDLAVALGGDTPERRVRSAAHHFKAGDIGRARSVVTEAIEALPAGPARAEALNLLAAIRMADDSYAEAADLLEQALGETEDRLALRVSILVARSVALVNMGRLPDAVQVLDDAVVDAERLGQPERLRQALTLGICLRFMCGEDVDETALRRAMELEDRGTQTPLTVRPGVLGAMLAAWSGRLDRAHTEMVDIRRRCIERGDESELMFVEYCSALIEIWRGNFADAALVAENSMERALQLNADVPLCGALSISAALAAYSGRAEVAQRDAEAALLASQRCGSQILSLWPITILGFLEVSLGRYEMALKRLAPLLAVLDAVPEATDIVPASCLPDAIEAMIALGRSSDAEPLIQRLERNGRRQDRAWMLAVGGRGRSMLLAAQGDIDGARSAAEQAMDEHARLAMPFERARTQMLLGQLQRRSGHPADAAATLQEALRISEELGTMLWAERARAELGRTNVGPRGPALLTPAEQRVAELAATGMTNRAVAAKLFISPKTVEANLARVYRKLNIHTRAELGRLMGPAHS